MSQAVAHATIRFNGRVSTVEGSTIVRLPERASARLPSRGQVSVQGTMNGHTFASVLEPDGRFGHWMRIEPRLQRATGLGAGDAAALVLTPTREWPEPVVPEDLEAALRAAPRTIQTLWHEITPMARWEWVRWINATNNPGTRRRRVEVTISKMRAGKRRPCCFNLASCTDPQLSRSGKLVELQ